MLQKIYRYTASTGLLI